MSWADDSSLDGGFASGVGGKWGLVSDGGKLGE